MHREIVFEIDENTGELHTTIKGISGKGCEAIADIIKEYAGDPSSEGNTPEYGQGRTLGHTRPQVRAGGVR